MIPGAVKRRSGPPYAIPSGPPYNAPTYCDLPTYDNTGSGLHFSVVDMHNEIGKDWNGWRYWAAFTPYYQQDDRLENPSIIVSSDGWHWVVPRGVINPIYGPPANPILWNADTDLAYDPASDTLVLAYQGQREGLWLAQDQLTARSVDGVRWPPVGWTAGMLSAYSRCASASVFHDADGSWLMYAVYTGGGGGSGVRQMRRWRAAHATGPWLGEGEVTSGLTGFPLDGLWHAEVIRDTDNTYRALIWAGWTKGLVFSASSSDGLAWSRSVNPILRPSADEPSLAGLNRWDYSETYRGSFTPHENGTHYRVWYSGTPGGRTTTTSWRIGYTEIPKTEWPAPPA